MKRLRSSIVEKIKVHIDKEEIKRSGISFYDIFDALLKAFSPLPRIVKKLKKIETWQKMIDATSFPKGTYDKSGKRISHMNKNYKGKRIRFDQRYKDRSKVHEIVSSFLAKNPNPAIEEILEDLRINEKDVADAYDRRTLIAWIRQITQRAPGRPPKK